MKIGNFILNCLDFFSCLKSIFYRNWNRLLFKMSGVDYGDNFCVYNRVSIHNNGSIKIGDDFLFTSGSSINPICRNLIGSLYTMTSSSYIEIGNRVGLSSAAIWAKERVVIGNDVNIGGDCLIIDNDAHPLDYIQRRGSYVKEVGLEELYSKIVSKPIEIDDDVWIGARCQILKGVHIGARSIIAAGSVVTRDIPSDVLAGGVPCRVIRSLCE